MRKFERVVAVTILMFFVPAVCGDWLSVVQAASRPNRAATQERTELFGVGADVKVTLASGKTIRGSIESIEAESFEVLAGRESVRQPINYSQVIELTAARSTYKASGAPDAVQARRVAAGLGAGQHVAVKVTTGKTYRGDLQAFDDTHFVLLRDRNAGAIQIAYADVQQLGPNLSRGAKIGIWAAAITVIAVWAWETFSVTRGTD